jgi:ribokinase
MSGRVIVVGSVNVDLVVTTEWLPGPGETVIGGRFARHHGGKGGNQAVAAARLGATTVFVGAVGSDDFGAAAHAALEAEGVDVSELLSLEREPTGGANAALTSVQVRAAFKRLKPTTEDVVLVGHEIRTGATHEALRLGRLAGATTILNPAPATGLAGPTLALADVLTPNDGELSVLAGSEGSPSARAKRLLGPDPESRAVLVTLGASGALLVAGRRARAIHSPRVEAIDTVGAGDTLNGALAAAMADGLDLATAARRAVVAASLAVTRAGAREGMPSAGELERALAQAG